MQPFAGKTLSERLTEAKKNKSHFEAVLLYEALMKKHPDSTSLLFDYIDTYRKYGPSDTESLVEISKKTESKNVSVYLGYVDLFRDVEFSTSIHNDTLQKQDSSFYKIPYSHYVSGLLCFQHRHFKKAEYHFKKELALFGYRNRPVDALGELYYQTNHQKLKSILTNYSFERELSYANKSKFYFSLRQFLPYFATEMAERFKSAYWFAIFTSLLISVVWMIYLRAMDIFKPEKWADILLIFAVGGICTFLCHPIYDFVNYELDFHINGEAGNDFLYCFAVIGGSEELVKFIPWFLLLLFNKSFKEPFDYILYASVSALGFACVENWHYLSEAQNTVNRMIIAVVSHMFDASIVAYAFILMHFKFKHQKWRYALPFVGFILAALSHGFYDFWLISNAVEEYKIITYLFFILSLHIWMFFKNNAINHSQFFNRKVTLNKNYLLDLLTFSILGVWMIEYLLLSSEFGTKIANAGFQYKSMIIGLFLIYMSFALSKVELKFGTWNTFKFLNWNAFFLLPLTGNDDADELDMDAEEEELIGLHVRFFTSKNNMYIGNLLPISGKIERAIEIEREQWYVVVLNTPLHFQFYHPKHVIVRAKAAGTSLHGDKVEVIFLLIPNADLLVKSNLSVKDLRYVGSVFSRPI
jgi:RsiW-degrading membrane proteinase PrsW (M82 family)/RNase P/RNase MRP subunit p29